ncbi:hypothetical protein T265_07208 [Opisthorchis viverrini]|uniref:Uncharacterized protein n=1 Tax=Opisthorchis viverrini TaxID=6198 RepID=A0A074ZPT5_OPIVI|nr:hypothetical protein T265_07208 [Opisthorchis viverrini]KER25335.1 hypothetical protein T265_07208 [Opisthorchis viverrini]
MTEKLASRLAIRLAAIVACRFGKNQEPSVFDTTTKVPPLQKNLSTMLRKWVNDTFDLDILDSETQNDGPYHAQSHLHIAVDDF